MAAEKSNRQRLGAAYDDVALRAIALSEAYLQCKVEEVAVALMSSEDHDAEAIARRMPRVETSETRDQAQVQARQLQGATRTGWLKKRAARCRRPLPFRLRPSPPLRSARAGRRRQLAALDADLDGVAVADPALEDLRRQRVLQLRWITRFSGRAP